MDPQQFLSLDVDGVLTLKGSPVLTHLTMLMSHFIGFALVPPPFVPSNVTMQAHFMRRAIMLAKQAKAAGQSPYGALIVDPVSAIVLAEGANHASHNPIWHGEMSAIANLSAVSQRSVYALAPTLELYTTAEPCPMCMAAIEWAGFGGVIYGTSIPFIEAAGATQIDVRASEVASRTSFHNVTLKGGVLANETDPLYADPHPRDPLHAPASEPEQRFQSEPIPSHSWGGDHVHGLAEDAAGARELANILSRVVGVSNSGDTPTGRPAAAAALPAAAPNGTHILVGYYSQTNRTAALAERIRDGAALWPQTQVRLRRVESIGCEDLRWMHGLALGSPVYWGTMAGQVKLFLDEVQTRCFGWPVKELRWRAGAAFATGAHTSAGKDATILAIHTFMLSVQMVVVGSEGAADPCLLGACATNRNESAAEPELTPIEADAAMRLGKRLAEAAHGLRSLMQ